MTRRARVAAFLAVVVLVTAGVAGFLVLSAGRYPDRAASARDRSADLAEVSSQPHVVFRSTDPTESYGVVAMVPLGDPAGPRAFTGTTCDRVDAGDSGAVCLRARRGAVTGFEARLLDAGWSEADSWPLPGVPSRTRLSPDGSLVATTVFVTGHSYQGGGFSTATEVRRVGGGGYGNLEEFTLLVDGEAVRAADRNIWGVTFSRDGRTFYATAASGGRTWLVRGDLAARTLTALRENAECPSLSPDERHVAYKTRVEGSAAPWAVAVLDLETGEETVLEGTDGLDDQVEWLDDRTLLYGLFREDQPGTSDVWSVPIDGAAEPEVLIPMAWSPAVVR